MRAAVDRFMRDHPVRPMIRTIRHGALHVLVAPIVMVGIGSPATADAPRAITSGVVCSLNGRFCAVRTGDTRSVEVRGHTRRSLQGAWRANVVSPQFQVGDDGRSLVEIGPGLNLVDRDAGAGTIVLTFHRPGLMAVPLRLRDIAIDPHRLPVTISHRVWVRAYGYDGRGSFIVETRDGRRLRFDPATGRQR